MEERLRRMGFRVARRVVERVNLAGERFREERVTAYSESGDAKIVYSSFEDGRRRLHITLHGRLAARSVSRVIEDAGGKVDFEEGERLYAVIDLKGEPGDGEVLDEVLDEISARLGNPDSKRR